MPTYTEKVQAAIEKIEAIDFNQSIAYDSVIDAIKSIGEIPRFHYLVNSNEVVYRSRPNDEKDYYDKISEISYPPAEKVTKFKRANKLEQPVFYCSDKRPTSYAELLYELAESVQEGDTLSITLSLWQLAIDLEVVLIINPTDTLQTEYSLKHKNAVEGLLKDLDEDTKTGTILLYEYFGKRFAEDARNNTSVYIITSAFANTIISDDVHGIMYPSVPLLEKGFNIAFSTKDVDDSKIRLLMVERDTFTVTNTEDDNPNFKQLSDTEHGIIDWENKKILWET